MSASWKRWHLGRALIGIIRLWTDWGKALRLRSGNEERHNPFFSSEHTWRENEISLGKLWVNGWTPQGLGGSKTLPRH